MTAPPSFGPPDHPRIFLLQFRGCKNLPMARFRCSWALEIFDPPPLIGVFSQFSAIFCAFGAAFAHIDRPFLISLIFFQKMYRKSARETGAVTPPISL